MSKEVIGKCPMCGGDVVESPKAFGCANWRDENGGCKFTVWKTMADKALTKAQVKALLEKGKTPVIKGFVSKKSGKEFEAALKLVDEGGVKKVAFDFDK